MPELRKDPVAGRWVIISTERAKRPTDFVIAPEPPSKGICPFCPGNEHMTPPTISYFTAEGQANWEVRVVSNKFPALKIEGDLNREGNGIYDLMNGVGAHEVVIESPRHIKSYSEIPLDRARLVIRAYRERLLDLRKDKRFIYAIVFKNVGEAAGASLEHTHSQIIALPTLPVRVITELRGSEEFFKFRGRCIFCDMVRQELNQHARIIHETERFVAFSPFAARFPYETWLLPKKHISHFIYIDEEDMTDLTLCLMKVLQKIDKALFSPPYNFMIHTSPVNIDTIDYYHWHIEITPRLTKVAGFEWGTGFYINPVPPEQAAELLRNTEI